MSYFALNAGGLNTASPHFTVHLPIDSPGGLYKIFTVEAFGDDLVKPLLGRFVRSARSPHHLVVEFVFQGDAGYQTDT
jgi:hypothetical protein